MSRFRQRIEIRFERWGRSVVRRRWWWIGFCLALGGLLLARLPELRVDNSSEAFLEDEDPQRVAYEEFKQRFDREDRILIALHPPEVFDLAFLARLRDLHRAIEREVPYVDEVTSLLNARNTRGVGDELVVEDLLEQWPSDAVDLARLRERVFSNPLYLDRLITRDAEITVVAIEPFTWSTRNPTSDEFGGFDDAWPAEDAAPEPLSGAEAAELVARLMTVLEDHPFPDTEIHVVGGPVTEHRVNQVMQRDVTLLLALSQLVLVIILFALFRRVSAVVLPLLVVVLAMLSTFGLMAWLDVPFSLALNMLPVFLIVVGVCDSIHILAIFYRRLAAGDARDDAIAGALGHTGLAVVMTSLTTAAGLSSFVFAELAPVADLGILAPAGVLLAMLYSLTLLPSLLAITPLRSGANRRPGLAERGGFDRLLAALGGFAGARPRLVLGVALLLVALTIPGLLRVRFSHNGINWLPEDDRVRIAFTTVDRELGGLFSLELLVDTGEENGLYEGGTLRRIERVMRRSEEMEVGGRPVNKATSIVDLIKEIHRALNGDRADAYVLPRSRALIAQELLLFENSGSDDVQEVADTLLRTARVSVQVPWTDTVDYASFLASLDAELREVLGEFDFDLTGHIVLFTKIFSGVIRSMARSYLFAIGMIALLMLILIGDLKLGMAAMIPNLIPIHLVLALMGFTGIPLDASTLLVGGVVIGLAVDDTVHFMHKFMRYYDQRGDATEAIRETLTTTGTALFFTSLVLASGYLVFLSAYTLNIVWFGLLAFTGTVTAFLADVLLAPALMVLVTGDR